MNTDPTTKYFDLSSIDDAQPCGYVRTLLCFKDHGTVEEVRQSLAGGARAIAAKWPHLRGRLVHRTGRDARGRFMVKLKEDDEVPVYTDVLTQAQLPFTYEELERQQFPIKHLDEALLCKTPNPAVPGDAAIVKANFLHGGGLILSICLHHCVVDGEGTRIVIEEFARGCNDGALPVPTPCQLVGQVQFRASASLPDRHVAYRSWGECPHAPSRVPSSPMSADHGSESSVDTSSTPSSPGTDNLNRHDAWSDREDGKTNILLTFSDAKLKQLKASITSTLSATSKDEETQALVDRLSTNDCLAALLWNGITTARGHDLNALQSSFIMAVDCRKKISPPVDPDYAAAVVLHSCAPENVESIQGSSTPSTIGHLASSIRKSIQDVDDGFIAQTVSMIQKFPDMRQFVLRKTSNDLLMTTWEKFAYQDMNFGSTMGRPQWARKPWSCQVADIVVLPKSLASDDIEVVVLMTNDQISRLLKDDGFMQYVAHWSG